MKGMSCKSAAVAVAIVACMLLAGGREACAEPENQPLPLSQAVELALKQNSMLKIAREKVTEANEKIVSARSQYLPQLTNNTKLMSLSNTQLVTVSSGSLGSIGGTPFPDHDVKISQSDSTVFLSETTLAQPITQLFKINEANQIARADLGIAGAELKKSENETAYVAHQLYYTLLIAYKEKDAAEASLKAAEENLRDSEKAVKSGNTLDVAVTGAKANLLQSRQALLAAENSISDVSAELNDLMGLPKDAVLEVTETGLPEEKEPLKNEAYEQARGRNGELLAARETLEKARHAVQAAKDEYIPDVTLFAKHYNQNGAAFLDHNVGVVGIELSWNIFDWGKREGEIGQRVAQQSQAKENLERINKRIGIEIDKVFRKLDRSAQMIDVAQEALSLRRENVRLDEKRIKAGTVNAAKYAETVAAFKKAEEEALKASLQYRLTQDELNRISGVLASRPPGSENDQLQDPKQSGQSLQ